MSDRLATYSFLPWLRRGIANQISGGTTEGGRAVTPIQLNIAGTAVSGPDPAIPPITRNVALFGPGDIQGIDARAIFRTDPLNWTTNYEPNYLAAIDFYDEDFPWRYTPAAPDGSSRIQPWIALIVLEEGEFEEAKDVRNRPLAYIEVKDPDPNRKVFPPAEQLWAFAHVQVNRSLAANEAEIVSTDVPAVVGRFEAVLRENPDLGYSRIVCPRRLDPNKAYHAFLMPAFESGRRAGLGAEKPYENLTGITMSAWASGGTRPEGTLYPVYYRWYFRTGGEGDFESLVRLLQPRVCDARVGRRDLDVQKPGMNIRGVQDGRSDLGGILKLGGALKVPDAVLQGNDAIEAKKYEEWATPYPQPIQEDIAKLVNLADDYAEKSAQNANSGAGITNNDPVITPPLYGTWHALTKRLLKERSGAAAPNNDNWVHELNLDPRFRVAAGIGTRVVQEQQEKYMDAAWEQLGKVLEANLRIRRGQTAMAVATAWYDTDVRTLANASVQKGLQLVSPLSKRVRSGGVTVHQTIKDSVLQPAMTSPVMRRCIRPRARLPRGLDFNQDRPIDRLFDRVNDGKASAAPPKQAPGGAMKTDDLAKEIGRPLPWLPIDAMPRLPDYVLTEPGGDPPPRGEPGDTDSFEGGRLKEALREVERLQSASKEVSQEPPRRKLDLPGLLEEIVEAIDPQKTIPKRVMSSIRLPARVLAEIGTSFVEAMAYPEIDVPMYEPLKNLGTELLLPNINYIEPNSVTLLETNQKFIESYMAGLNHEFARELLWREYPTDQRGSYFRQFWDVSSYFDPDGLGPDARKEKLRDIPRLDHWTPPSKLGTHNHRKMTSGSNSTVVLAIRGELLKRYPTAVIYAHRAEWQTPSGTIDTSLPRRMVTLTAPGEESTPPHAKVRTPLYEAKVDPDIYFFGFDLEVKEARGGTGRGTDTDAGWFFVIKERPGEPRFGLDIDGVTTIHTWNDLSWKDVTVGNPVPFLTVASGMKTASVTSPGTGSPALVQYEDDKNLTWNDAMSAADVAYVLFQVPVLVAIHASELLPPV